MISKIRAQLGLRGGFFILLSLIIEKISNFILMIIAARFMSLHEYGIFSYVRSLVGVFLPFTGLGGNHALLRFGVKKSRQEQYQILLNALVYGALFSFVLILLLKTVLTLNGFFHDTLTLNIFNIYVYTLLSYFIFDLLRNFYRINNDNRSYAFYGILYAILTLLLGIVALLFFNMTVFLFTLVALPLVTVLLQNHKALFNRFNRFKNFSKPDVAFHAPFWKYGILIGAGAFLNQFFLQADVLVLGYLDINPDLIAKYKVAALLVYTAFFIPNAFLVRDFTHLVEQSQNPAYLKAYLWNYMKYAGTLLLLFIPLFMLLSPLVLTLLFGERYAFDSPLQNILIFAFVASVLLRMPFGNILNAVGKAKYNVLNALITLPLAIAFLIHFTRLYGVKGSAYAMVIMFGVSGLMSALLFVYYYQSIKSVSKP